MNKDIDKSKIYLKIVVYIISMIVLFLIMNSTPLFSDYHLLIKILYVFIIIFIVDTLLFDKYIYISFIIYMLFLFITLYVRDNKIQETQDPKYIIKWIKLIFTNKIVFYNIIGNIVIYIPLGIYIKKFNLNYLYKIILLISIPILLELFQFILHIGVFDYIDIILNIIGVILGYIITSIRGTKNERR